MATWPCTAQDIQAPPAGQLSLQGQISWVCTWGAGLPSIAPTFPSVLKSLERAKMDPDGFSKGRDLLQFSPSGSQRWDLQGWEEAGKVVLGGLQRPIVPVLSSFTDGTGTVKTCKACPEHALCHLPLLQCWLAGITLLLCSISELKQLLPPLPVRNHPEGKGKNRVRTKVPKS